MSEVAQITIAVSLAVSSLLLVIKNIKFIKTKFCSCEMKQNTEINNDPIIDLEKNLTDMIAILSHTKNNITPRLKNQSPRPTLIENLPQILPENIQIEQNLPIIEKETT